MEITLELRSGVEGHELELVRQAREGSRAAFDELFRRHRTFVYNVCYRMLGSSEDAVDATQNAFIQAYRGLRRFRGDASFRSWVCRIAINAAIGEARREQRRRTLAMKLEAPDERETEDDRVREALLDLPANLRSVLVLFYFQGLSCEETAEALGTSEGAVRVRLHRARAAFKKKYEELGQ